MITTLNPTLNQKKYLIAAIFLAGAVGLHLPQTNALFVLLTPYSLFATGILILYNEQKREQKVDFFLLSTFCSGFLIEAVGVATGKIFGAYHYTNVLGASILGVPLIIGLNWTTLIYAIGTLLDRWQTHFVCQAVAAAALLTLLDVLIEPVAIYFRFWIWDLGVPGLQNYMAWFGYSLLVFLVYFKLKLRFQNPLNTTYLLGQVLFFGLNLCIIYFFAF